MVYGSSLENWRGVILTVGSNPTLSATAQQRHRLGQKHQIFSPKAKGGSYEWHLCTSGFLHLSPSHPAIHPGPVRGGAKGLESRPWPFSTL